MTDRPPELLESGPELAFSAALPFRELRPTKFPLVLKVESQWDPFRRNARLSSRQRVLN